MTTITIQIPDEEAQRLSRIAAALNSTLEELATDAVHRIGVEMYQEADRETVDRAIDYVVTKNLELYKRLA